MSEITCISPELQIIIEFVQNAPLHSYHPIKKKYTITQSFIFGNKRLIAGQIVYLPKPKIGFAKLHADQSLYNKNIALLKEYILFRYHQGENRFDYKEITFSPDFTSIRIGSAL